MKKAISLFVVPGRDSENDAATRMVEGSGVQFEVITCTLTMADTYECPFLRDERGRGYFGPEGLELFVSERKTQHPIGKARKKHVQAT